MWRTSEDGDPNAEHGLEDDWGDSGGQVDVQDQHGQRHKEMLGSGLFKSFDIAEICWSLGERRDEDSVQGQPWRS